MRIATTTTAPRSNHARTLKPRTETPSESGAAFFDVYAAEYDDLLNAALAVSGETKDYFARGRMSWLAARLRRSGFHARNVLDYGCGTGTSIPLFFQYLGCDEVVGVDVSEVSLDCARQFCGELDGVRLLPLCRHEAEAGFELAFSNGVFHHIVPPERPTALRRVYDSLRPGGVFAFWENNPWNPGTRYSMRINPFDRDAVPISAREGRRLLTAVGFQIVETTYAFYFPRPLSRLRFLEPCLSRVPFGGQYLVLATKPGARR